MIPNAPADPAKLAIGIADTPNTDTSRWNAMTMIAPSAAPAETPSVSGDASGFLSSAWNTTPATANALPTSAAAITRGSRATKNTCASTFSANGIERSNARVKLIDVLPTSGAVRHTTNASAPKPAIVSAMRRRTSLNTGHRNDGHVTGARVHRDIGVDAVQRAHGVGRQHAIDRSLRQHAAVLQKHQLRAQRSRKIQIVRRHEIGRA